MKVEKQIKKLMTGTCEECGSPIVRNMYKGPMESVQAECDRCGVLSHLAGETIEVTAECNNCLYVYDMDTRMFCCVNPPFGHNGDFPKVSPDGWCSCHDFDSFRVMEDD